MDFWKFKSYTTQEKIGVIMLQVADVVESYLEDIVELYEEHGEGKTFEIMYHTILDTIEKEKQELIDNFNTMCHDEIAMFAINVDLNYIDFDYGLTPQFKILKEVK